MEFVALHFSGLQELYTRRDNAECLLMMYRNYDLGIFYTLGDNSYKARMSILLMLLETMMSLDFEGRWG
jgi:hypothetical protein